MFHLLSNSLFTTGQTFVVDDKRPKRQKNPIAHAEKSKGTNI